MKALIIYLATLAFAAGMISLAAYHPIAVIALLLVAAIGNAVIFEGYPTGNWGTSG